MAKTVPEYIEMIKHVLTVAGTYTPALDLNIHVMAGTLRCYDLAMDDINSLTSSIVTETNSRGAEYTHAHPAFTIRREAEDQLRKQMKELGLTAEGTRTTTEDDPMLDLSTAIAAALGKGKIVKPR